MKKNYMKPSLLVVELQQRDNVLESVSQIDSEVGGGGGDGSGLGADVKGASMGNGKSVWDEEW